MRSWGAILLLAGSAVALGGCENSCQSFCVAMADYRDECGAPVSDAELQECVDRYANPSKDELATCSDFGQPDVLRRQWTCEDVNLYRDPPAAEG